MLKNNDVSNLPMAALKEIPKFKANAKEIIALVKHRGRVIGYKLSDNQILNKEDAVKLARAGEIKGVGIATRKGTEYLKSLPDGKESNNLGSLPTVASHEFEIEYANN
ncbi:MAG: DUF3892 domain-containing protein [Coprobacillaceae bacterium]